MENMTITSAQYLKDNITDTVVSIGAVIDGTDMLVPIAPGNRHYDEIQRQVAAGDLTIADAD